MLLMLGTLILDAVIVIYFMRNILFDEQTPSSKPGYRSNKYVLDCRNFLFMEKAAYKTPRQMSFNGNINRYNLPPISSKKM